MGSRVIKCEGKRSCKTIAPKLDQLNYTDTAVVRLEGMAKNMGSG